MHRKVEQSQKWLGKITNIAIVLSALAGIAVMQSDRQLGGLSVDGQNSMNASGSPTVSLSQVQEQEALRLQLAKVSPTFGFDNLIADWTFLKFIQYFGDSEVRSQTGYALNTPYFDIITMRDPRWVDIYPFLSTAISYYLGKPEIAVSMMDRGTDALSPQIDPQAWRVWRFKGLDQFLLLGDIPGAIRSHEMAADWALGTPDEKVSPVLRQTAEFLKRDPDSTFIRFQAWSAVYYEATDKLVRQRAKSALLSLGARMQKGEDGNLRFFLPSDKVKK
ncbi:hypothetical protein [Kamptonema sp. UHCC 0994]|uniref:hypothetical protein n=1 Tax=Kamptonema sp. UHCC 0994 TaxID=3031329 RepID=UPI0023B8910F|nr:hypothetical protein [Kamptonema sp. UHCC 0994]MDF0552257.1 hypothetical protein [Kamptonema sp. UHCC 0994]